MPDSGHQIQTDNPKFTCEYMVNFVFGKEHHQRYSEELDEYLAVRDHQY